MATLLNMPAIVADATDAVLHAWMIPVGAPFSAGDALAEIETEKATVELEAETAGRIAHVLVDSGTSVPVGAPIAVVAAEGDDAAEIQRVLASATTAASSTAGAVAPDGPGPETVPGSVPEGAGAALAAAPESEQAPRLFASPLARRLAKEAGVDLDALRGSGPSGRIIRSDVERAIGQRQASAASATARPAAQAQPEPATLVTDGEAGERIPLTRMRQTIARRLTESKTQVPHFYLSAEVRMDELLALRAELNASGGQKITVNDLVVRAIALALAEVPQANVSWGGDHLVQHRTSDVSVAIATEGGLFTPVVRGAESRSIGAVSADIADFARRAQDGKIRPEELVGGSFSVSNLGMYGTREFSAILNPPQAGILAVGAAEPRAVVREGEIEVATMMTCTLSADHRAVDGAVAAQLLRAFQRRMEQPLSVLR